MNPIKSAVKCCGCIMLTQLIGLCLSIGSVVAFIAIFYFYLLPMGEEKIVELLNLPNGTSLDTADDALLEKYTCSGCVLGIDTTWPTNTTGFTHFLDTTAGVFSSGMIGTVVVVSSIAGLIGMAMGTIFPAAASGLSLSSGLYEMTHLFEQAQFIGMISQLQIEGAPVFLYEFSKQLAWTNFNIPIPSNNSTINGNRRLEDTESEASNGDTGPRRYAALLNVEPKNLFAHTLILFAILIGIIHAFYIVWVLIMSGMNKSKESVGDIAKKWYRKVIWAIILILLLAQYIFAMSGSYYIAENMRQDVKDDDFYYICAAFACTIGFTIFFGIFIVSANSDEIKDVGTIEHSERPFAMKYGAYYDEYRYERRYFFIPRILLAIVTGGLVGVVENPSIQLLSLGVVTLFYLSLLFTQEPQLLRFLYYIGIISVFIKVVLICLLLALAQDDFFPQNVRNKVAYVVVALNIFVLILLVVRQLYTTVHKMLVQCNSKHGKEDLHTIEASGYSRQHAVDPDDDVIKNNRKPLQHQQQGMNQSRSHQYSRYDSRENMQPQQYSRYDSREIMQPQQNFQKSKSRNMDGNFGSGYPQNGPKYNQHEQYPTYEQNQPYNDHQAYANNDYNDATTQVEDNNGIRKSNYQPNRNVIFQQHKAQSTQGAGGGKFGKFNPRHNYEDGFGGATDNDDYNKMRQKGYASYGDQYSGRTSSPVVEVDGMVRTAAFQSPGENYRLQRDNSSHYRYYSDEYKDTDFHDRSDGYNAAPTFPTYKKQLSHRKERDDSYIDIESEDGESVDIQRGRKDSVDVDADDSFDANEGDQFQSIPNQQQRKPAAYQLSMASSYRSSGYSFNDSEVSDTEYLEEPSTKYTPGMQPFYNSDISETSDIDYQMYAQFGKHASSSSSGVDLSMSSTDSRQIDYVTSKYLNDDSESDTQEEDIYVSKKRDGKYPLLQADSESSSGSYRDIRRMNSKGREYSYRSQLSSDKSNVSSNEDVDNASFLSYGRGQIRTQRSGRQGRRDDSIQM